MSKDKVWTASNTEYAQHIGVLEVRDTREEWHEFEVFKISGDRLVFGIACNAGFLESGYMLLDEDISLDENLQELLRDLDDFYTDGPSYTSKIVFNERM